MKKDKNSSRSKKWMQYNDFVNNPNCKNFLVKLFDRYGISYKINEKSVDVKYTNAKYRIWIDSDNIMLVVRCRKTGKCKRYYKDNPYQELCEDIVSSC